MKYAIFLLYVYFGLSYYKVSVVSIAQYFSFTLAQ